MTGGVGEANGSTSCQAKTLPIVPNYISSPQFPYTSASNDCSQPAKVDVITNSSATGKQFSRLQDIYIICCISYLTFDQVIPCHVGWQVWDLFCKKIGFSFWL